VKPLEVKGGIITYTIHKKLKAEGKISSTFDQEYFDSLRKSVLYWNGIEWVAKPMGIDHSLAPRQQ
jgi:hypothetical protein